MTYQKMTNFNDYVASIQRLAEECGVTPVGEPYCDPEAWRNFFNEGLTPREAWEEEVDTLRTNGRLTWP